MIARIRAIDACSSPTIGPTMPADNALRLRCPWAPVRSVCSSRSIALFQRAELMRVRSRGNSSEADAGSLPHTRSHHIFEDACDASCRSGLFAGSARTPVSELRGSWQPGATHRTTIHRKRVGQSWIEPGVVQQRHAATGAQLHDRLRLALRLHPSTQSRSAGLRRDARTRRGFAAARGTAGGRFIGTVAATSRIVPH